MFGLFPVALEVALSIFKFGGCRDRIPTTLSQLTSLAAMDPRFREHLVAFTEQSYQLVDCGPLRKYGVAMGRLLLRQSMNQPNANRTLDQLAELMRAINGQANLSPWTLSLHRNLNLYILGSQHFDIKYKLAALSFFTRFGAPAPVIELAYRAFIEGAGALGKYPESRAFLDSVLCSVEAGKISLLFKSILSLPVATQVNFLEAILAAARKEFQPTFEGQIKLRILADSGEEQVASQLALRLIEGSRSQLTADNVAGFEMARFIREHSKETLDCFARLCCKLIAKDKALCEPLFRKMGESVELLFSQRIDEEGLSVFNIFVEENLPHFSGEMQL